jgi:hypothetical protein
VDHPVAIDGEPLDRVGPALTLLHHGHEPVEDRLPALEGPLAIIPGPATACIDGLDNDGDGFTDYPDDPGCADADDLSERSPLLICDDGSDNDGDGLIVCPGEDGGFLEVSVWRRRVFANIARKVVGKGRTVTPHTLRHTYASIHLSRGTDLLWVQRQGGWQSPTVLLSTYAHFLPTELTGLADVLTARNGTSRGRRHRLRWLEQKKILVQAGSYTA